MKAFDVISGSGSLPAAADAGKEDAETAIATTAAPAALTRPDRVKPVSSLASPAAVLASPFLAATGRPLLMRASPLDDPNTVAAHG